MLLLAFMRGGLVACCWVAGLFFVRFHRSTSDRLFLFFAASFWVFSLNWLTLALLGVPQEARHLVFLLRLVAFGLILVGIWDKNRRENRIKPRRRSPLVLVLPTGTAERRTRQ
jgi:hypothetical protein